MVRIFGCILALLFALVAATAGADQPPSRDALLAMLRAGEFEKLEAVLQDLEVAVEQRRASEWDIERAYRLFQSTDPSISAQLRKWLVERPGSPTVEAARAIHVQHLARLPLWIDVRDRRQPEVAQRILELLREGRGALSKAIGRGAKVRAAIVPSSYDFIAHGVTQESQRMYEAITWHFQRPSTLAYRMYAKGLEPWWNASAPTWDAAMVQLKRFVDETRSQFADDPEFAWVNGYYEWAEGERLLRLGDLEAAIRSLSAAISAREEPAYYFTRGVAHAAGGASAAALADFDRAVTLDPAYADAWSQRAARKRHLGRLHEALADYERAVALDPLNPEYLIGRASVLILLDRGADARRDADAALAYGAHSPWVQMWRGFLYRAHDRDTAAAAYRRAAEVAPADDASYLLALAEFLVETKDCGALVVIDAYRAKCLAARGCETAPDEVLARFSPAEREYCRAN